jgi:hypothetical protein
MLRKVRGTIALELEDRLLMKAAGTALSNECQSRLGSTKDSLVVYCCLQVQCVLNCLSLCHTVLKGEKL